VFSFAGISFLPSGRPLPTEGRLEAASRTHKAPFYYGSLNNWNVFMDEIKELAWIFYGVSQRRGAPALPRHETP
jgi:hypothetical protein